MLRPRTRKTSPSPAGSRRAQALRAAGVRTLAVALVSFTLSPAPGSGWRGPASLFVDGFESGDTCAWSRALWYFDADGDQFGDADDPGELSQCPVPFVRVANNLDCDDLDDQVNPLATESCNGYDDDCDGALDGTDSSLQQPGCENQAGACQGSLKPAALCVAGAWGSCRMVDYAAHSASYEAVESSCDGTDNDCNGLVDANDPNLPVAPEVCNGVDDDCDGALDGDDAGLLRPSCEEQVGVCQGSLKPESRCLAGSWGSCVAADYAAHSASYEANESSCDGLDNDCDEVVDEACGSVAAASVARPERGGASGSFAPGSR